jgi:hypothetical protein
MDERNINNMEDNLQILRDSLHAAARKPEGFWIQQRQEILNKIHRPADKPRYRMTLIWASALMTVLLFAALFMNKNQMPAASFAAGSDHELLIEVEQALNQSCPEALVPAVVTDEELIDKEIRYPVISQ